MDDNLWPIIKASVEWLILPLAGGIMYFFRKYIQRVELVEKRMNEIEVRLAVVENNIQHIREDIADIKKGIEKMLTRYERS